MYLKQEIKEHQIEFIQLCDEHDVKEMYAFGSSVNGNFKEAESDIDLLVELKTVDPTERGENLLQLWDKLEVFFKRKVDLLTKASIKNPVLKLSIDRSKILIYDGKSQEISV
ncbi:MAG: DNA polymerase subunit beta [Sphingobacteriaceae bacterium]|nr:DNA polymerase subunit beta [Sphingobacteriaceae bacterium]